MTQKRKLCKCGKGSFRDAISAKIALAEIQHNDPSGRYKTEQRVYLCPIGGKWHLTSQPRRPLGKGA